MRMAHIFYKNPRVVAIGDALAALRMPHDISWIVAQYAWQSAADNLSLALKDFSNADGSGVIFFGDNHIGSRWEHSRITWTASEQDYGKKEYTFHTAIRSHRLRFSQLFPDDTFWLPREHIRSKYGNDYNKERYIAIINAAIRKYSG